MEKLTSDKLINSNLKYAYQIKGEQKSIEMTFEELSQSTMGARDLAHHLLLQAGFTEAEVTKTRRTELVRLETSIIWCRYVTSPERVAIAMQTRLAVHISLYENNEVGSPVADRNDLCDLNQKVDELIVKGVSQ